MRGLSFSIYIYPTSSFPFSYYHYYHNQIYTSATHLKAKGLFIDALKLTNAFDLLEGDISAEKIATDYETKLKNSGIPFSNSLPVFDFMLIGMYISSLSLSIPPLSHVSSST